jgi:nucleoid-associated protein YgaU
VRIHRFHKRSLAPLALGLGVWLAWPAQSLARALVRFVHGVPGVGSATVKVDGQNLGSIAFAQSTKWQSIRSGAFHWSLSGGGKTLASGTATVGDGAYDIVVLEKGMKVSLGIYKAEAGKPGTTLVRVIHGAPELGSPELTVDGKQAVKRLAYTQATPYVPLSPGTHSLGAMRPGDSSPLVSVPKVRLEPDVAYSAIVLGTRGQRVRVVQLVDRGGPLTRRATPVAQHSTVAATGSLVVRSGDSLWAIARRLVGPHAANDAVEHKLVAIWNLNSHRIGTGDPNLIFPGTHLRLP